MPISELNLANKHKENQNKQHVNIKTSHSTRHKRRTTKHKIIRSLWLFNYFRNLDDTINDIQNNEDIDKGQNNIDLYKSVYDDNDQSEQQSAQRSNSTGNLYLLKTHI